MAALPLATLALVFYLLVSYRLLVSVVLLPLLAFALHRAFGPLLADMTNSGVFWMGVRGGVYLVSLWCYLFKMLPCIKPTLPHLPLTTLPLSTPPLTF